MKRVDQEIKKKYVHKQRMVQKQCIERGKRIPIKHLGIVCLL